MLKTIVGLVVVGFVAVVAASHFGYLNVSADAELTPKTQAKVKEIRNAAAEKIQDK
jgi:hypothetical protein